MGRPPTGHGTSGQADSQGLGAASRSYPPGEHLEDDSCHDLRQRNTGVPLFVYGVVAVLGFWLGATCTPALLLV